LLFGGLGISTRVGLDTSTTSTIGVIFADLETDVRAGVESSSKTIPPHSSSASSSTGSTLAEVLEISLAFLFRFFFLEDEVETGAPVMEEALEGLGLSEPFVVVEDTARVAEPEPEGLEANISSISFTIQTYQVGFKSSLRVGL